MKSIFTTLVLFAVIPLGLTGCFSATVRSSNGWTGEKTPTQTKVAAGVADVATMPVQAPLLVVAGVSEARKRHAKSAREMKLEQIRSDPEYIFREKLHVSSSDSSREAVEYALWDHAIPFTDQQLRRLYKEMGWQRIYVVGNPHCSLEFLQEIWGQISKDPFLSDWQVVEQLTRNPATPIEWLEIMAERQEANHQRSGFARQVVERRKKASQAVETAK